MASLYERHVLSRVFQGLHFAIVMIQLNHVKRLLVTCKDYLQ